MFHKNAPAHLLQLRILTKDSHLFPVGWILHALRQLLAHHLQTAGSASMICHVNSLQSHGQVLRPLQLQLGGHYAMSKISPIEDGLSLGHSLRLT